MKDNLGQSVLHVAVDAMNCSAVEALIELGIAQELINSQDNFKMTPMHIAAINFDLPIFNSLLLLKPNLELKDSEGKTYKDYLMENEEITDDIINELKDFK